MGRSPGFGSARGDLPPPGGVRPVQAWFPCGSVPSALNLAPTRNSPDRSTKSTRSRPCGVPTVCRHGVSGSLSLPSRGPFHLSFTVLCSIGHWVVFSLAGWSPLLHAGFLVSRATLDAALPAPVLPTGLSPSLARLPRSVPLRSPVNLAVRTPGRTRPGLGSSRSARRYSGNRLFFPENLFFLFLRLLRCFSSPGSPHAATLSRHGGGGLPRRVSPFGCLRIPAHLRLPAAFRSLSRPSSAPSAKASAPCPSLLNLPRRLAWRRGAFVALLCLACFDVIPRLADFGTSCCLCLSNVQFSRYGTAPFGNHR